MLSALHRCDRDVLRKQNLNGAPVTHPPRCQSGHSPDVLGLMPLNSHCKFPPLARAEVLPEPNHRPFTYCTTCIASDATRMCTQSYRCVQDREPRLLRLEVSPSNLHGFALHSPTHSSHVSVKQSVALSRTALLPTTRAWASWRNQGALTATCPASTTAMIPTRNLASLPTSRLFPLPSTDGNHCRSL